MFACRRRLPELPSMPLRWFPLLSTPPTHSLPSWSVEVNEDPEADNVGSKWSLRALWEYLDKAGENVRRVRRDIAAVLVKTLIAAESEITPIMHRVCPKNAGGNHCFELFGFDILLDAHLKPWLIEVGVCLRASACVCVQGALCAFDVRMLHSLIRHEDTRMTWIARHERSCVVVENVSSSRSKCLLTRRACRRCHRGTHTINAAIVVDARPLRYSCHDQIRCAACLNARSTSLRP